MTDDEAKLAGLELRKRDLEQRLRLTEDVLSDEMRRLNIALDCVLDDIERIENGRLSR